MHMFHFDPNNLPEDMDPAIKAAIIQSHMTSEKASHDEANFINGLDEAGIMGLRGILMTIMHSPDEAAMTSFYLGILTHATGKYGVCIACGKKHDEELAKMTGPGPAPDAEISDEYRTSLMAVYNVETFEEGVRCTNCQFQYVSLDDRMLRNPGPEGCHGCIHKSKFG